MNHAWLNLLLLIKKYVNLNVKIIVSEKKTTVGMLAHVLVEIVSI